MTTRDWWRSPLVFGGVASSIIVVALDVLLRHLPGPASAPALFLGRFHPLAVHLPIGVILLVAAAEAASFFPRYRQRVDGGIALTLPVLLAGVLGAFLLGHLLARSGGFPARSLALHRRLELFAVVGVGASAVAWAFQSARGTTAARNVYRGVFGLTFAVLSGGAHFGGTMTRGDNYLSKYAPGFLAPFLGGVEAREKPAASVSAASAPKTEPLVFADVVQPILKERCGECHGEEKAKGELRLDSLAAIRRGGENGPVLVAGSADRSPLFQRMLLPMDDDDRMPPEGKPGPTPAERDVIRFWIERGATDALRVRDALPPASGRGVLERALGAPAASGVPTQVVAPGSATAREPQGPAAPAGAPALGPDPAEPKTGPRASPRETPVLEPSDADPVTAPPSPASGGSAQAVLAEKCAGCHGAQKQKGKLRVDSLDALLVGGKHGPAVVPGRPAESLLVQRVELPLGAEGHMPPKDKAQLTAAERAVLSSFARDLSPSSAPIAGTARPAAATTSPDTATADARGADSPAASATEGSPSTEPTPPSEPPGPSAPVDDTNGPADPALVARLPSRVDLYATASALLAERCSKCHSGKFPAGNLSVADRAALLRGGNGGPAVVPGDLSRSTLWQRVSLPLSEDEHMPPEEEPQLVADELALLRAFVLKAGTRSATVATSELSAGAVRALAARAPGAGSSPPAAAPRTAGCGACTVGETSKPRAFSRFGPLVVALSLLLRRLTRGRRG
jgi:uncharacterized membrane protein